MQSGLVPVDGEVGGAELELLGRAGQRAAAAESVPRTPGAPVAAALNNFQDERVFVAQTVVTKMEI